MFFAIVHIATGAMLFYQNLNARPVRYSVNKSAGGRGLGYERIDGGFGFINKMKIYKVKNYERQKYNTRIGHGSSNTVTKPYDPNVLDTVGVHRPFNISYHGGSPNGAITQYQYFSLTSGFDIEGQNICLLLLSFSPARLLHLASGPYSRRFEIPDPARSV